MIVLTHKVYPFYNVFNKRTIEITRDYDVRKCE